MAGDLVQRNTKEVIFIDMGIDDWQSLADSVPQGSEIVTLDPARDGLAQMAEWAVGREGYSAMHILSHGSAGQVQLGTASLNSDSLSDYSDTLAQIGQSLTADGDILLYGCNVAANQTGVEFIGKLAQATGADIAASDDLTGAAALGGDWVLEQQLGEIQTLTLTEEQYQHVLAAPTDQDFTDTPPYMQFPLPYVIGGGEGLNFAASPGAMSFVDIINDPTSFTAGNAARLWVDMGNYVEFSSVDPDGSGPETKPLFTLDQLAAGYSHYSPIPISRYVVSGWTEGSEVVSVEVNLDITGDYGTDTASVITYTKSAQDHGMYSGGTLTFGDAWTNIDTVRFTASDPHMIYPPEMMMFELLLDTIDFSEPVSNSVPTGNVTITGTPTEDETLSADTNALADEDGLGTFSYQWLRDGTAIDGATGSTYTLTQAEVGKVITVKVSYTDDQGTDETVVSAATSAVVNVNDAPTGNVTITGTATEDETLSADTSALVDENGLGTFSYVWKADGTAIIGATGSTYTLTQADVGKAITVEISYTDGQGTAEGPIASSATTAVANVNDAPTGSVTISGTAEEDQTLTASNTLADEDGLDDATINYQWLRDGNVIDGATGSTYTLTQADVGSEISVQASYTDDEGTDEVVTSSATDSIAEAPEPPPAPDAPTLESNSDTGMSDSDGITRETTPTLTGSGAVANADVVIYRDDVQQGTVTADNAGNWSYVASELTEGTYTFTARSQDLTGNQESAASAALTVTVDTTEPFRNSSNPANGKDGVSSTKDIVLGFSEAVEQGTGNVTLYNIDTNTAIATIDASDAQISGWGNTLIFIKPTTALPEGAHVAVQWDATVFQDAAGNNVAGVADTTTLHFTVNSAPVGTDKTLTLAEDSSYALSVADVDFSDTDESDSLDRVRIETLPDVGELQLNGSAVTAGDVIARTDLENGHLVFTPAADENGSSYASLVISVHDGTEYADQPQTLTFNVTPVNDAPTGTITISGTAEEEQTLTASNTLADEDGLGDATINYQWLRDGSAIDGATGSTYTLTQADVGTNISVRASYTDGQGTVEEVASSATSAVANVNDAPTGSVTISGTAEEDQTLTASNTLEDEDGLDDATINYQWLRDGNVIDGATGSTYTLTQADVGTNISVQASYTDDQGTDEAITSAATATVANINDAPTGSVTITGTARQGATLTASNDLDDEDGLGEISYQWLRDGVEITGATGENYTLVRADVRAEISVQARYIDGQGTAETVTSIVTDPVAALPVPPPRPDAELEVDEIPLSDTVVGEGAVRQTFTNTSDESRSARLVENTGNNNVVTATLPGGMQLTSDGARTATERDQALSSLVASIEGKAPDNLSDQAQTAANWLSTRPEGTQLDIRTLTFTSATTTDDPIEIRGESDNSISGFQEAFVIDVSNLPSGTRLRLDNIDFASIKGAVTIEGGEGDNVVVGDNEAQVIVLGPGDDELWGGGGDDTVGSMGGNDRLFGEQGNDLLFSDSGANVFHGGLDADTVRYEGNRDDYVVSQQHSVITVYRHDKPEDADTLINIEQIVFADDQLALEYAPVLEEIAALYAQVLGRQGDVEGVQYWAAQQAEGVSRADIALNIMLSEEASILLPESPDTQVEWLYETLLGRESDMAGRAYWQDELAAGHSLADITAGFLDSQEMQGLHLDATQWSFIA